MLLCVAARHLRWWPPELQWRTQREGTRVAQSDVCSLMRHRSQEEWRPWGLRTELALREVPEWATWMGRVDIV